PRIEPFGYRDLHFYYYCYSLSLVCLNSSEILKSSKIVWISNIRVDHTTMVEGILLRVYGGSNWT
ncbi:MAG: hypothetical protein VX559_14675, partial [Pseudomonadota bacterium]|nr:hypothetical protein [Pseudomonadota bacterium]